MIAYVLRLANVAELFVRPSQLDMGDEASPLLVPSGHISVHVIVRTQIPS